MAQSTRTVRARSDGNADTRLGPGFPAPKPVRGDARLGLRPAPNGRVRARLVRRRRAGDGMSADTGFARITSTTAAAEPMTDFTRVTVILPTGTETRSLLNTVDTIL